MSSAVVSTSAAPGRPFLFDAEPSAHMGTAAIGCPVEQSSTVCPQSLLLSAIQNKKNPSTSITPASRLEIRPAPEMATSGIPAMDALTGGLPRGCLTELCGPASSGRTSVMLAALAAATRRAEYCALIDASDALDPHSLAAAGVDLDRLLWVRCSENSPQRHPSTSLRASPGTEKRNQKEGCPISGAPFAPEVGIFSQPTFEFADRRKESIPRQSEHRLEQVLRATDLLLESGGFGLIILDLADVPYQAARRIPLTTWFRFRRAVEHKPTILLAIEQQPIAGSCSSLQLRLESDEKQPLSVREPAAKRQKNAAHGASRGEMPVMESQAPEGRKKNCAPVETIPTSFPSHMNLLTERKIRAELIRSRLDRKPARSIAFETKTAWAG